MMAVQQVAVDCVELLGLKPTDPFEGLIHRNSPVSSKRIHT
jgi:hypothetical protein